MKLSIGFNYQEMLFLQNIVYYEKLMGVFMSELVFKQLSAQVDMLSYAERIKLLDKIVRTLHTTVKTHKKAFSDFSTAFGLWKDRSLSVEEIRSKAWGRS